MSETKRRLYFSLVAIAIAIWAFSALQGSDKTVTSSQEPIPANQKTVSTQTVAPIDFTFVEDKPWGSDPFYKRISKVSPSMRTQTSQVRANTYKLKAIIYNETSPAAFLNGRMVRVGDTVDGANVIRISKRAVTLKENGREITVTVKRG